MKRNKFYSTAAALIFALTIFAADTSCKKDGTVSPEVGYYTCSMHPQVIQQQPGDCPICQMKLTFVPAAKKKNTKKPDHDKHEHGDKEKGSEKGKIENNENFKFSLAASLLQNAKVYTVPAKLGGFSRESTYSGHVDFNEDPNMLVIVNTKYDGWIEKLYVSNEGQWIKSGAVLIAVYSQKILAAKEEYITTYNSLKNLYISQGKTGDEYKKDSTVIAARRKLINLDVPASQIARLEKTGIADRRTYYRSPISGVVVKKTVLQGSHIKAGQELFRIANLGKLWVFIHIFEKDLAFVKKGQSVIIKTSAYPDKKFKGKIGLIYPFFDMKTRDVKVRIIVGNKDMKLKPGMYVKVDVESKNPRKVITIPDHAVIYSGDINYVFVSLGDGEFEVRPVTVITQSGGKAVISHGLKENDLVVANGQFLLDSEASLKESLQKGRMAGHQH